MSQQKGIVWDIPFVAGSFVAACVGVFIATHMNLLPLYAVISPSAGQILSSPLESLPHMIWHIFGHANVPHLFFNLILFMFCSQVVDRNYGKLTLILLMALTGIVSAAAQAFLAGSVLIGASGVVFLYIILAIFAEKKECGRISLWGLMISGAYLGKELYFMFSVEDQVSQLAHLCGALVAIAYLSLFRRGPMINIHS